MIEIEINADTLQNSLGATARRTAHTKPLMTQLARIICNAVLDNLATGDRPAWASRKYPAVRKSSGLLQASGRLRNSITPSSTNDTAVVSTNVEYAAIHNFGGKTSPHLIRPKKGKALKFGGRFAKQANHLGSSIPAYPFMTLQPEDEKVLSDAVAEYLAQAIQGRQLCLLEKRRKTARKRPNPYLSLPIA